jgi:hypothetical protein
MGVEISGARVLVAAKWFTGDTVDVGEAVDPATHQHCMHGRGLHPEPAGDLDRAESVSPPQPNDLAHDGPAGLGRAGVRT